MKLSLSNKLHVFSSVARVGGLEPPHWPEEYSKYPVFSILGLIFALKTKIAPPMVLAMRAGQEPDVMLTRRTGFQPG